ncbi:MAG: HEAT repeat domain-containing protein [Spirochaetaceae bacterium]|nr:MAG: HEAT repeat domain-containing protein [Spirochaetaceae bacterium]
MCTDGCKRLQRGRGSRGLSRVVLVALLVFLGLVPVTVRAEEPEGAVEPTLAEETEGAAEPTLIDGWREVLMFGLDNEVIELLSVLRDQRERRLFPEIAELFDQSVNPRLRQRVLEFFTTMEYPDGEPAALVVLEAYREVPTDLLLAAIRYVSLVVTHPQEETRAALREVAEGTQITAAETAIRALGRRGGEEEIGPLVQRLSDRRAPSPIRAAVILALGDLRATEAVDELLRIAGDTVEESTTRQFAADSLGRIGDEQAIPLLMELAVGSDTMLRAYAVNALGAFRDDEVERIIVNSLRDSFWRVRVAALEAVARHDMDSAIPVVQFRAQRDPEPRVRTEAIRSLAQMSDPRARTFLHELVLGERNPEAMRITALQRLADNDWRATVPLFEQIVETEHGKPQSRMLDQVGRIISTSDEAVPHAIYERFLDHPNFIMQIYGIRAAGRHGISALRERVSKMTDAPHHQAVRRAATDALERM